MGLEIVGQGSQFRMQLRQDHSVVLRQSGSYIQGDRGRANAAFGAHEREYLAALSRWGRRRTGSERPAFPATERSTLRRSTS